MATGEAFVTEYGFARVVEGGFAVLVSLVRFLAGGTSDPSSESELG